ncbi:hypothetical protein Q3G72_004073 [Acer saccharum]|nr:hypothetical protein Q3G72_004073 [Acer saccharum]
MEEIRKFSESARNLSEVTRQRMRDGTGVEDLTVPNQCSICVALRKVKHCGHNRNWDPAENEDGHRRRMARTGNDDGHRKMAS